MIIFGNLGRDPEVKQTKGGKSYYAFSVAEAYGKDDNRTTNWFSISYFGKPEEIAPFKKGDRVELQGDLKVNLKTDKEGKPAVFLDMLSSRIKAAPLPPKKEAPADGAAAPAAAPAAPAAPAAAVPATATSGGVRDQFDGIADGQDDDIPF